ncbi:MAG: DUF2283 domain-containing protein [Chloroflexi bacterium]|nr:DUF2283 domain-containing protein [Chloroflexota bacterium]
MRIEYDKEVDALYIHLRDAKPVEARDIEEGVTADLDAEGHIVGIEILDAVEKLGLESLLNVTIENMPLEKVSSPSTSWPAP